MSERRFRGCASCGMQPNLCKCAEFQEVAPERHAEGSNLGLPPGRLTGATSCDSAELIRARDLMRGGVSQGDEDRHALLRMVDELREVLRVEQQFGRAIARERDELRAKLAEAELDVQIHRVKFDTVNQCILWDTPYPREAELLSQCRRQEELSEAWKTEAADWKASSERNRKRAEAAEARVTALEQAPLGPK
jgi:hypothetical protein